MSTSYIMAIVLLLAGACLPAAAQIGAGSEDIYADFGSVITADQLSSVLERNGYEVLNRSMGSNGHEYIDCRNPDGYIVRFELARDMKLILMISFWVLKDDIRSDDSGLLISLEKANTVSWYNTYALNKDGTSLKVNSYVTLCDGMAEEDLIDLFDTQWRDMKKYYAQAGLDYYTKTGEIT
ncbi:MAG: hypothetical protein A4E45_00667 [Methanosaeta sp. PtaB.Bin039]|nr:MAG: hypothetical protein A4E45_00667 [Methanosaeta sp. PtaB.Bin039]OPY48208.1 MAG: hypothetical protein A4E47_00026 [Methanosaeta sp. PtaU1.Bin028]HOT07753.1 hypothetical protein [Methanotrichaceae archaeon]HQF16974.1 hypothetical protein [Methanotrichaceae archaeon]HQI91594.1 hypothetical protein [Methanotrichaceae archaeon]